MVVALALAADDTPGRLPDGAVRLGGLADSDLAKAVWNNASLTKNVQRAINHINSTTSIRIDKDQRRRYLSWTADQLDYNVFLDTQSQARALTDLRGKFEAMNTALELVQGRPMDALGTPLSGWLQRKRNEISAEVCDTAGQWLEAAILLNEKWVVLDKACQLHGWFPTDETICHYLMYLLYRSGRRARALECRDLTFAARDGKVSRRILELSRIIEEHGDVVRATESLNLRIPSSGESFRHRFSFAESGEFLARMLGQDTGQRQVIGTTPNSAKPIGDWKPDLIVGINRGGSIVGGMLAKHFGLDRVMPIIIPWRTDEYGHRDYYVALRPQWEADHLEDSPDTVQRILLTDEAFRTGQHVKLARQELREAFPHADIRVATLISVRQDVSHGEGPGRGGVGGATYYGQLVSSRNFELPWDP